MKKNLLLLSSAAIFLVLGLLGLKLVWPSADLNAVEIAVLDANVSDSKVDPDMEGPFFVASYGKWLSEKVGVKLDERKQYLYCSGFKLLSFEQRNLDDASPKMNVMIGGYEQQSRIYLISKHLNHPQNAPQFLYEFWIAGEK